jgi:hypothetical protein
MNTKRLRTVFAVLLSVLIFSTLTSAQTPSSPGGATAGFKRVGIAPVINRSASATPKFNGIPYNGGPIIDDANGVNVYYIWYGDWRKDKATQDTLTHFISHLGGSPYFNINTTYYDYEVGPNGTKLVKDRVINGVHYMGSTNDYYSYGVNLTDDNVGLVIQNAVTEGRLPLDHNGVYYVLTSADVTEITAGGFCNTFCGFHGFWQPAGALGNLIGAYVGHPARCPDVCTYTTGAPPTLVPQPNNNTPADGMVSTVSHELFESVTDPFGDGWIDPYGNENGDLCNLSLGPLSLGPDGRYYNLTLKSRTYLAQEIWVNAKGGYCAKSWDE